METRKVAELKLWDKNPRNIKEKDFERLKKQIKELGQYKPLLITPDGTVLGGNMRLRAYRDMDIKEAWVSVVDPKNEEEALKYALSDNDRAGYYDNDLLANLSSAYPEFKWKNFSVDLNPPASLDDLINPETEEDSELICSRCGCDELDFLEYNHIGGDGLEILCRVCNAHEFLERKNGKSAERFEIKWN